MILDAFVVWATTCKESKGGICMRSGLVSNGHSGGKFAVVGIAVGGQATGGLGSMTTLGDGTLWKVN
jgi:hypothetical protein